MRKKASGAAWMYFEAVQQTAPLNFDPIAHVSGGGPVSINDNASQTYILAIDYDSRISNIVRTNQATVGMPNLSFIDGKLRSVCILVRSKIEEGTSTMDGGSTASLANSEEPLGGISHQITQQPIPDMMVLMLLLSCYKTLHKNGTVFKGK